MLKFDLLLLLLLTLQLDGDWSKIISCIIGFLAGMSLFIASELKQNTLTGTKILIRLLSAFGACFFGVTFQQWKYPEWNTSIVIAGCTFLSESVVSIVSVGFLKYIKNISGVQSEQKNDPNV